MKFCDMHNDAPTADKEWLRYAENNYLKGNIIVFALFYNGEINRIKSALKYIKKYYYSFENIGFKNYDDIQTLVIKNKPVYASLTWNNENYLAFGCNDNTGNLKQKGVEVIKRLNEAKIILDTAHLSRKAFYECAEIADRIVNSHTCFDSVCKHKRNITDEQAKIIIQKGGIIGLCLYKDFVSDKKIATVEDVVRHIDYFVNKFSYEHLSLGTDFYGAKDFAENIKDYESLYKIVEKLQNLGYNDKVIKGIFYNNLAKFLEREYCNA